jgi:putative mRNA 3-end processing factor
VISWLALRDAGLYVAPGDFYIDPVAPVARAVVTHGHADHARPGHRAVLATRPTLDIMRARYGEDAGSGQSLAFGVPIEVGGVRVVLHPAGHILGSAQVALEHGGARVLVSGDFKRTPDPTCAAFELPPGPFDLFITEATFGLPIFRHPPPEVEIARLLESVRLFPDRAHLVGVYTLGKCQRMIALLRRAGWEPPIYVHGALLAMIELYREHGIELGPITQATGASKEEMKGRIVLAPPTAIGDRWTRRLPDPVLAVASGWMAIRARARQRGVELPLVISDHADWSELTRTMRESGAPEIGVTHGLSDGLVHFARSAGLLAESFEIKGYEEEEEA